jgi:eukaryotic-like serine/threonine-protein kinase
MSDPRPTALTTTAPPAGERWDAVARLYDDALALPADRRDAYLRECAADTAVVSEVRELLARETGAAVDRAIEAIAAAAAGRPGTAGPAPPSRIGAYEVLREIGSGGMGTVYLARRADGAYQRLVALKVSRHPVANSALGARFLAERDILAGLAHPNIVPLFDAGVTDEGRPYFTMQFVDGAPIDVYCDRRALDVRARLRLVLRICSGVAAAHRALVVHRDLKPTNVLVTDGGDVKVLDFGIAKLLQPDLAGANDTATDGRLMTPAYASPEQIRGAAVSTATDVYALGLLLYELLSGRRAHRFPSQGLAELVQVIGEREPLSMSEAVMHPDRRDDPSAADIGRRRGTSVSRLIRQLRGDLERIVTKALAKAPEQRYASAAHLAEDLERFLDGRPVEARGASTCYRASRFVRRHHLAVGAALVTVAALAGYAGLSARHARELAIAAERERQEAVRSREVADFMVGLFEAADPSVAQSDGTALSRLLDQGRARADALSAQPRLQARLLNAIGRVYVNTGRFGDAVAVATRALAISRAAVGDAHADVARDYRLLGLSTGEAGRPAEAVAYFRTAVEIHRRPGGSAEEAATDLHHLAYALAQSRRADEAEPLARESLAATRALRAPDHEEIAASLSTLAYVRRRQGHPQEAATLYREALGIVERRLGTRHPEVPRTRQNLAAMLSDAGQYDDAAGELTRALAEYRVIYGGRHPSIATTLNNLGQLEYRRKRLAEAIAHMRAALDMRRALLGAEHPSTLLVQANLASTLGFAGRLREGEAELRALLARPDTGIEAGPSRPTTLANLASLLNRQGRLVEAESIGRQALALADARQVDALDQSAIRVTLGQTLLARGRAAEAIALIDRAVAIRRERLGPGHERTRAAQRELDQARLQAGARRP